MKFHRGTISAAKPLSFAEDLDFAGLSFTRAYPLLGIPFAHAEGEVYKEGGTVYLYAKVQATCLVRDGRTAQNFELLLEYEDDFALLTGYEGEEEGYVYEKDPLDLNEVLFHSIVSHVPKNASMSSTLPSSGEGYDVYGSEEELPKQPNAFALLGDEDGD